MFYMFGLKSAVFGSHLCRHLYRVSVHFSALLCTPEDWGIKHIRGKRLSLLGAKRDLVVPEIPNNHIKNQ
jgi:hypothetical protein